MRGTVMFKHLMLYAKPSHSNVSLPETHSNDVVLERYSNGRSQASYSSSDITDGANRLWNQHFSNSNSPLFMTLPLHTPLGLATFTGSVQNGSKIYVAGTYNMQKILQGISKQGSNTVVIEKDIFEMEPPSKKAEEFQALCENVERVVVGSTSSVGKSQ
jgi:hypothetical protein